MLTPLDIENKKFSKQMMNGYNVEEIDDFLDKITEDYAKLYKEVAELKNQMNDMEDNVSHYKTIESTLQNTLIMAQSTADDIKKVATQQAEQIVKDAELNAKETIATLKAERITEAKRYEDMKKQFDVYKAKMEALLISQLELLKEYNADCEGENIASSYIDEDEISKEKSKITTDTPTYESVSKTTSTTTSSSTTSTFNTSAFSDTDSTPSSISDIKTSFDPFSTSSSSSSIKENKFNNDTFSTAFSSAKSINEDSGSSYNPTNGISGLFGGSNTSDSQSGESYSATKGIGVSDLFEDAGTINVTFPKNSSNKRGK